MEKSSVISHQSAVNQNQPVRFDFQKLTVYQRAMDFSNTVYAVTKSYPKDELYGVVSQIRRSTLSIALNIAEGVGRSTPKDRKRFYVIAKGSAFECVPLVEISQSQGYISKQTADMLFQEILEISKMLMALIKSLKTDD